jgi:hypothetical protein
MPSEFLKLVSGLLPHGTGRVADVVVEDDDVASDSENDAPA